VLVASACGVLYLTFNWQYIRGNFVAWQAQQRIERVYSQVRDMLPKGARLAQEEKPESGTYAFGLSDGAEQLAYVHAQQSFVAPMSYSEVEKHYEAAFTKAGWNANGVTSSVGSVTMVFTPSDDTRVIVRLCHLPDNSIIPAQTTYRISIDFNEGISCASRWLDCVAAGGFCGL
jgi:hypothetical protein